MYATSSQYGQRCVLITGGYDQKIRLWNTETGAEIRTLQHEKSQVNCMALNPEKTVLVAGGYQRVSFYKLDYNDDRPMVVMNKENSNLLMNILAIGYQDEGSWVYTASEDKTVRLWDIKSSHIDCIETFTHTDPISCAVLHPKQTHMLIGDELGNVIKWDLRSNTSESIMTGTNSAIRSISINSDGTIMAAVNNEGCCYMWTVNGALNESMPMRIGQNVTVFQAHRRYALKCLFSPDSTLLATSSADGTTKLFYTASRALKTQCQAPSQKWVWDLAFTPDSKSLFTASTDTAAKNGQFVARKWSVDSGQISCEYQGHVQPVVSLALCSY